MYYSLHQTVHNMSSKTSDQKCSHSPIIYTIQGLNTSKFVVRKVPHRTRV